MNSTLSRTNAIGSGTRNIPVNVPVDERDFWGRLATELGAKSVGELHRLMWLVGLQQTFPAKAEQLREIRRRYYGTTLLVLFIGSIAAACLGGAQQTIRRARFQQVKIVRRGKWEAESVWEAAA